MPNGKNDDAGAFREDALSEQDAKAARASDAMMADLLDSMRVLAMDDARRKEVTLMQVMTEQVLAMDAVARESEASQQLPNCQLGAGVLASDAPHVFTAANPRYLFGGFATHAQPFASASFRVCSSSHPNRSDSSLVPAVTRPMYLVTVFPCALNCK